MKATLEKLKDFLEQEELTVKKTSPKPRGGSGLQPGDVCIFKYQGQDQIVIVVATARTHTGQYTSSRGNRLLTCIKLDLSEEQQYSSLLVFKNLYNKGSKATYKETTRASRSIPKFLSKFFSKFREKVRNRTIMSLFGKSNFRTYIIPKMSNIQEVSIGE